MLKNIVTLKFRLGVIVLSEFVHDLHILKSAGPGLSFIADKVGLSLFSST